MTEPSPNTAWRVLHSYSRMSSTTPHTHLTTYPRLYVTSIFCTSFLLLINLEISTILHTYDLIIYQNSTYLKSYIFSIIHINNLIYLSSYKPAILCVLLLQPLSFTHGSTYPQSYILTYPHSYVPTATQFAHTHGRKILYPFSPTIYNVTKNLTNTHTHRPIVPTTSHIPNPQIQNTNISTYPHAHPLSPKYQKPVPAVHTTSRPGLPSHGGASSVVGSLAVCIQLKGFRC